MYVACSLGYWLCDYYDLFPQYKIQAKRTYQPSLVSRCIRRLLFNHVSLVFPLIFLSYPVFIIRKVRFDLPLPSLWEVAWRSALYLAIEDLWVYAGHRALHSPWLYKNVHALHHEFRAPFGMVSSYASPVEFIFLGIGTFLGPVLVGGDHIATIWFYAFLRQWEAIDVHSGYDFPWGLSRLVPVYCGPAFHDFHHATCGGNYGTTFVWWDWLFGTDKEWRERRKRTKVQHHHQQHQHQHQQRQQQQ